MQPNSPPPLDPPGFLPSDPTSSSLFDWTDFLDFNLDEALNISFPQPEPEPEPGNNWIQPPESLGLVRKRDPRLVCSNFLAGRVPCACPELDEKLEEESGLPGKKRARVGGPIRCQVPTCEADITELKGYHKRHRVCLQCANASAVVLDGETKRYCQQCGKFHLLPDFDEGKRSCRRKLEWHNRRRRRKSNDSKGGSEKEAPQRTLADDVSGDDDTGKDGVFVNNQMDENEALLGSNRHVSTLCSGLGSENIHGDSVASFAASGEMHTEGQKQNSKCSPSPACCDVNGNAYSSICPAGRISFKLYDWNPAEFPRRLRLQIFQWLASMPIELEGYIRPGCTILTAFISMPKPMWLKLLKEPTLCIKDLVSSPGSMLSGRGTVLVYLNDMMFRVTKDAKSVLQVKVKEQAPRLHYIYPSCFETGRTMEFVACGSHLLQPKFRFLVSFAGRYLAYNICVLSRCCKKGDGKSFDHQLLKITIPMTDTNHFGPAFIEVENQAGLSNFIPILISDKETCTEMGTLQQKISIPLPPEEQSSPPWPPCEIFASRHAQFSDFVLDLAWSLKKPALEQPMLSSHILRLNHLLTFLMNTDSYIILERVLRVSKSAIENNLVAGVPDSDLRLLRTNIGIAQIMLNQKSWEKNSSAMPLVDGSTYNQSSKIGVRATNSVTPETTKNTVHASRFSPWPDAGNDAVPFLTNDVVMNVNLQTGPRNSCSQVLSRTFLTSRQLVVAVVAGVGICCAVCTVVLHPQGVSRIATTIRRCLFDDSSS